MMNINENREIDDAQRRAEELRACPFCGGNYWKYHPGISYGEWECRHCGARTPHIIGDIQSIDLKQATKLANTRADDKRQTEDNALTVAYMQGVADEREKHRADDKLMDDVEAALEGMCSEAVVLSAQYLEAFHDYPMDATILGWDKARWIRAMNAKNYAKEVLTRINERKT